MVDKFSIIRDTREKEGWNFDFYSSCAIESRGLKTGDYTLEGLEEILCIERKANTGELSMNLGKHRKRFEAELERMAEFRWAYILCEFSLENLMQFPKNSSIPPYRWKYLRMNGKFMAKLLSRYQEDYDVEVVFCGERESAENKAIEIFKEITETIGREADE
tara:strand:+ start:84 stop:569 length:486 start_codon:yes stop_codon:yes gene_type:complete